MDPQKAAEAEFVLSAGTTIFVGAELAAGQTARAIEQEIIVEAPSNVPSNATQTLRRIEGTGSAPAGYKGGGKFSNDGRGGGAVLPKAAPDGAPIAYKEYDVNPYSPGVNRGAERIVIGSDGRAYYTGDHYKTFTEIK